MPFAVLFGSLQCKGDFMKEKLSVYGQKLAAAGLVVVATIGSAQAALPAEVDTMFTSIQTDGEAAIAKAWPLMLAITGGFILIGLVRRALSSGAR